REANGQSQAGAAKEGVRGGTTGSPTLVPVCRRDAPPPEPGCARREANSGSWAGTAKEGGRGGTMGSPTLEGGARGGTMGSPREVPPRSRAAADPLLAALVDLLLPERDRLLERVDRFRAGCQRGGAVRRRDRDHDRGLADLDAAHPVGDRHGA